MMKWQQRGNAKSIAEYFCNNMGVRSLSEVTDWFKKSYASAYAIKNMGKVIALLKTFQHKRVTIVGDYDVDGMTSTTILYNGLTEYGFTDVHYRIPKRFTEGFGINEAIIDEIPEGLVLTCDNGIAGIDAVKKAKEKGLTVIITDHHEPTTVDGIPQYPAADMIIDPKALPSSADFNGYCGAGLAYKLICALFDNKKEIRDKYLALAAIGTVADVMELREENYVFVRNGLKAIGNPNLVSCGLAALLSQLGIGPEKITAEDIGYKLAPCLNSPSRLDDTGSLMSLELLMYNGDKWTAAEMAKAVIEKNEKRKILTDDAEKRLLDAIIDGKRENLCPMTAYIEDIHPGLIGIIAARIAEKYRVPTFAFSLNSDKTTLKGSARTYGDYNIKASLDECADLLLKYGGHKGAAGLSLSLENFDEFTKYLNEHLHGFIPKQDTDVLYYDIVLTDNVADARDELVKYQPYGEGNPEPVFRLNGFKPIPTSARSDLSPSQDPKYWFKIGKSGKTIKGLGDGFAVICFQADEIFKDIPMDATCDLVGTIRDNIYNGVTTHQFVVLDAVVSS